MRALVFVVGLTGFAALCAPAAARVPLSQVSEIDNGLMAVLIADEVRKRCDGIDARLWRAYATIRALEARARDLGYSKDEIDDYVTSSDEKARMRRKAERYLASVGVAADDTSSLCAYGRDAIDAGGAVGRLLR